MLLTKTFPYEELQPHLRLVQSPAFGFWDIAMVEKNEFMAIIEPIHNISIVIGQLYGFKQVNFDIPELNEIKKGA